MHIHHRGLKIELAPDDARIGVIEALLFGGPLPAPFAVPSLADTEPPEPPAPPAPPRVEVPAAVGRWWQALQPVEHEELRLLAEQAYAVEELTEALGVDASALPGHHSRIGRFAAAQGLGRPVLATGRRASARRYHLRPELAPFVRALAEDRATLVEPVRTPRARRR